MNKTKFVVEVTGDGATQRFRNLLDALEKLSNWGASRELTIEWDGDGCDKLKVIDSDLVPTFTKEEFDKALNYSLIRILSNKVVKAPFIRKKDQ